MYHVIKGTFHFRSAQHPWGKAARAALSMGACVLIGVVLGHVAWGLMATVGGFASLYVNSESYEQRAVKLVLVSLGLAASMALGTWFAGNIWTLAFALSFVSMSATWVAGAFSLPPPGGYFFILVCALGTGLPLDPSQAPMRFGLALLGGGVAWVISMSGWLFRRKAEKVAAKNWWHDSLRMAIARTRDRTTGVIPAIIRIGIAVLAATFIAFLLGNPRPYWVPLTCASVLQGATVTATIQRTFQRAAGTALGVLVGGAVLWIQPSIVWVILSLMAFQWVTEILIVRNYGLAVIFITPMPLLLAETGFPGLHPTFLVQARLVDTLLGCAIGVTAALAFQGRGVAAQMFRFRRWTDS